MSTEIFVILLSAIFVILIVCIALLIINIIKVNKYTEMYNKALKKFNSKDNLDDEFQTLYDRLNEVENSCEKQNDKIDNFDKIIKSSVQKIGFVKYNAYDDTDTRLSFALAMLDDFQNGVIINHIYSKHGSNIYAKLVKNGKISERITDEEQKALEIAFEDKSFKERKTINLDLKKNIRNKKIK